jgi:hypothetical protein
MLFDCDAATEMSENWPLMDDDAPELPESVLALEWQLRTAHRGQGLAINREMLAAFASAAAPNSPRALKLDGEAFDLWCRQKNYRTFPATSQQVAEWRRKRASEGAALASLGRYKASLGKIHRLLGLEDPTKHELIRLAIASHRRQVGSQQKPARPLRFLGAIEDPVADSPRGIHVRVILAVCDETPTGLRNRALLSAAYDTFPSTKLRSKMPTASGKRQRVRILLRLGIGMMFPQLHQI